MIIHKKVIAFAIVLLFLVNVSVFADVSDKVQANENRYERPVAVLSALDILDGYTANNFEPDETITRADMAILITRLLGLDSAEGYLQDIGEYFSDVSADYRAAGSIITAVKMGIISGYGNGRFGPEDTVTYEQVIKMLVNVLGYGMKAETSGGYPVGYLFVAAQLGILDHVDIKSNQEARMGPVMQMVYNCLDTEIMNQVKYGDDAVYSIERNKTLLTEKLKIFKEDGQITGNEFTRLGGAGRMKKGEVEINGQVFEVGATNADRLLGHYVTYYYKENKENHSNVLLYIEPKEGKNDAIVIKADDIVRYDAHERKYIYWIGNKTSEAIVSGDADIIFNGKVTTDYSDRIFVPDSGYVTLLDVDDDREYDIVFTVSYRNIVVEKVDLLDHVIYDKYDSGNMLILDPSDSSIDFMIKNTDGASIKMEDLKTFDVLAVAESADNKLITVTVVRNVIQGKVDEISEDTDRGRIELSVKGQVYALADNYIDANERIPKVGDSGVFYLDVEGKIAAISFKASDSYYGYIFKAMLVNKGVTKELQLKLFDDYGDIYLLKVSEKAIVDGIRGLEVDQVFERLCDENGIFVPQLVKFEVNDDGDVCGIDTAAETVDSAENENSLFTIWSQPTATLRYNNYNKSFGGDVAVSNDTVVFMVPWNPEDEDKYLIKRITDFVNGKDYTNIMAYNSVKGRLAAEALVIKTSDAGDGTIDEETPVTIVGKVTMVVNDDGQKVHRLQGFQNGMFVDVLAADDVLLTENNPEIGKNIKPGDAIRYSVNAMGDINHVQIVYDVDTPLETKAPIGSFTDRYYVYFGSVYEKDNSFIKVTWKDLSVDDGLGSGTQAKIFQGSKYKICMFDREKQKLSLASYDDIYDYVHFGLNCSKVLIYSRSGEPRTITIYK